MKRRDAIRMMAGTLAGGTAAVAGLEAAQQPAVRQKRTLGPQKANASTVEAIKSVESKPLGELGIELAEYYQFFGRLFASRGGWRPDDAAEYTKYLQRTLGEKETGTVSVDFAARVLSRPRCAMPDYPPNVQRLAAARWKFTELTYTIGGMKGMNLDRNDIGGLIRRAWDQWQAVCVVRSSSVDSRGGASVGHDSGNGRMDGFDGPSGTLAWAELPPASGFDGGLVNLFDSGEQWTGGDANAAGIRFLNVACHEIGHLLGLDHSSNPSELMAPFYDANVSKPQAGDIARIKALYPVAVPRNGTTPPTDPPTNPPTDPPTNPPSEPPTPRCGPRWLPPMPRLFPRRRRVC